MNKEFNNDLNLNNLGNNIPEGEGHDCPLMEFIDTLLWERPLGVCWDYDKKIKFIKGVSDYKIIEREDDEGRSYSVAVKPKTKNLPTYDNIDEIFIELMQDTIIDFLIKFKKEK